MFLLAHRSPKRIFAIEPTESDLITAKASITDSRIEFIVASGLSLPFDEETFDAILCSEVIEHLPKKSEVLLLCEIARVLKPGGRLYLTTPAFTFMSTLLDPAWYLIGHRHYSTGEISACAEAAGLSVVECKLRGERWDLLSLWNMYVSKWIFRRSPILENYTRHKVNAEYAQDAGFMGIFIILTKKEKS